MSNLFFLQTEWPLQPGPVTKAEGTRRASLAEPATLFASLQHRAFAGQLS